MEGGKRVCPYAPQELTVLSLLLRAAPQFHSPTLLCYLDL